MLSTTTLNDLRDIVRDADYLTRTQWEAGEIETEPEFTGRLIGSIKMAAAGRVVGPDAISLDIRTLRDRGPSAPETEFGADLCSVFRQVRDGQAVAKGMLLQAKRSGKDGVRIRPFGGRAVGFVEVGSISRTLARECERMLAVTPDSFVVIYSTEAAVRSRVVSALTVLNHAPRGRNYEPIGSKPLPDFYWDHFACFVGDRNITSHSDEVLRQAADRYGARHVLEISATSQDPS